MIKDDKYRNYTDILNADPHELFFWLQENFIQSIPVSLENTDELTVAGNRLGELTNTYSYLMSMLMLANLSLKEKKRNKEEKEEINTVMDVRDVLQNAVDTIKAQYTAISRMISVKKQVNDEIRMV